ncbi:MULTISPECIES: TnpV protein [unclassified Enterococcus]|uniref:TnpV protein n=1 Tax=Enterococcus sp. 7E2_DIV0204 TaxID=1834188 RepID=UPI000A33E1E3
MNKQNIQFSNDKQDDRPLGDYGKMANLYLEENQSFLHVTLMMEGELMNYLHRAEDKAIEEEIHLTKEALKKYPYPSEANPLQREKHLQVLISQVREVVREHMIQNLNN